MEDWKPIPKVSKQERRERKAEERRSRGERRSALREQVIERSGGECEWSGCLAAGAHMAHIRGIGRGGDPLGLRDDLANVVFLCVAHHDLLDGRSTAMRLREIEELILELVMLREAV